MLDSIMSAVGAFNPIQWAKDQFTIGQARDEARTVRQEDRADQLRNEANQNSIAMQSIKAGGQGSIGSTMPVGMSMQTPELSQGQSYRSASERKADQLQLEILQQQKEGLELDNLKKGQDLLPKLHKPGRPLPGNSTMGVNGQVLPLLDKVPTPGKDPMNILDFTYVQGQDGAWSMVPSEAAKERSEDNFVQERFWDWRNYGKPLLNNEPPPVPKEPLKPGHIWFYSPVEATYYQVPDKVGELHRNTEFKTLETGWSSGGTPKGSYLKYRPGRTIKWKTWPKRGGK